MTEHTEATPRPKTQAEIDISNLRFYSQLAATEPWQTSVIHWSVIVQTLKEIAARYEAAMLLPQQVLEQAAEACDELGEDTQRDDGVPDDEGPYTFGDMKAYRRSGQFACASVVRNMVHALPKEHVAAVNRYDASRARLEAAGYFFASPASFSHEEFQAVGAKVTDCPGYSGRVPYLDEYASARTLIEQMRDALRVADRLDSWAYSSAIAGYQQANRMEEEFGRKIDAAKEQVAGALAAAAKFLEGR